MSRLTLRLPDTLHRQLETLAKRENTSLNQYIVYALTQQSSLAYSVQTVPEGDVSQQQAAFTTLRQRLGQASSAEIEAVLSAREVVEPENDLQPEKVRRLQQRLRRQSPSE